MRIALIDNGVVVNVVEAEPDYAPGGVLLAVATQEAGPDWTYDGTAFHPPESPLPPVPKSVSMFQAREALRRAAAPGGGTLLEAVDAAVAAHGADNPTLALAWEYAVAVERDGAFVVSLAAELGLDAATLDALFRAAAEIDA